MSNIPSARNRRVLVIDALERLNPYLRRVQEDPR